MENTIKKTAVVLHVGNVAINATLNTSKTAQDLVTKLPYTANLDRYEFDYCGIMDTPLAYDEADKHNGWINGDICLADNYFTILFEGEEQSESHTGLIRLGRINDEDLSKVSKLPSSITVTVTLP